MPFAETELGICLMQRWRVGPGAGVAGSRTRVRESSGGTDGSDAARRVAHESGGVGPGTGAAERCAHGGGSACFAYSPRCTCSTLLLDAGELVDVETARYCACIRQSRYPASRPDAARRVASTRTGLAGKAEAVYQALIATEDPRTTAPAQIDLARLRQRRGDKAGAQDLLEEAAASEDPEVAAEARGLLAISRWLDCAPRWIDIRHASRRAPQRAIRCRSCGRSEGRVQQKPKRCDAWLHLGS